MTKTRLTQNEKSSNENSEGTTTKFAPLTNTPVLPGSLTGTIYIASIPIQRFLVSESGNFDFSRIGTPEVYAIDGCLNLTTGELSLTYNVAPGLNYAVLSYEYRVEPVLKEMMDLNRGDWFEYRNDTSYQVLSGHLLSRGDRFEGDNDSLYGVIFEHLQTHVEIVLFDRGGFLKGMRTISKNIIVNYIGKTAADIPWE